MAITKYGCHTYLVNKNKYIRFWQQQLAHICNARVLRETKFVDGMKPDIQKEYKSAKVLIDFNDSDSSKD